MQTILHARIEELAQDMAASFKQQVEYQVYFEQKVDARFDKLESRMDTIETKVNTIDSRVSTIETKVNTIESKMVTKEEIAALEKRMLDIFQQLLTAINNFSH